MMAAAATAAAAAGVPLPTTVLPFEAQPGRTLTLVLFKDVANAKDIGEQLPSWPLEIAAFNAAMVPDVFPLHVAAAKALEAEAAGRLTLRNVHAEVVFNLSGTKHISESLRRFGVSDTTRHVLAGRFDATPEDVEAIAGLVQGTPAPLSELLGLCDAALVHKMYKISPQELLLGEGALEDAIVARIASRDCA